MVLGFILRECFSSSKLKVFFFIVFVFALNVSPNISVCRDGIYSGYCITRYGFPFPSFLLSGEIAAVPSQELIRLLSEGAFGFIFNVLVSYGLASLIYYLLIKAKYLVSSRRK